jgi:uncharacterized protein (DUF362 family)
MSELYSACITKVDEDLKGNLTKSLEFINWKKQIKKDSSVFIKPNFTFPFYKEGITTTPALLKNLLEIIKDRADNVILGEADGGNHSFSADEAFKGHDVYNICREVGVELVNLSKLPSTFIEDKIQGKRVKVQLPNLLLEDIDCFISVPVLKVHVMTGVTLSIKNLWGCYPDAMRCLHHQNFNYKIALITKLLDPKIVVIDSIYALDGHGPMYGEPVKMNLIITSDNPVVSDALGAEIMGIPLKKARHILVAEREGIGTTNLRAVKINDGWEQFKRQFRIRRRTSIDKVSWLLFNSDALAKLVFDSPFTPLIYKGVGILRSKEEKEVADQMKRYY